MNKDFEFIPGALVIGGKTFPASYENLPGRVVIVAEVTEDGKKSFATIEVPENDVNYPLAYAVADETARAAVAPVQDPEPEAAPDERPETISPDDTEKQEDKKMPVYEVGYEDGGIFSVNMIEALDEETARAAAEAHAARYGYKVSWLKELFSWQVRENRAKGMPLTRAERPETISAPEPSAPADPEPETAPEPAPEVAPETAPESAPEPAPEPAPEVAPETAPESAPEPAPDEGPETISPDEAPEPSAPALDEKAARGPAKPKDFAGEAISGNGWSIVFDTGMNRTRVIVADPLREKLSPVIEQAGFYFSRNMNSWNKRLTHKAHRAALALADSIRAALDAA